MPFSATTAQSILSSNVGKYIGLMTSESGGEPTISSTTGYARGVVSGWDTSKSRQIANNGIIFMFECLSSLGTFTHFGCFNAASGGTMTYYGELTGSVTVNAGYVPLIRKNELIIGLDKDTLESY